MAVNRRYQAWIDAQGGTTLTFANGNAGLVTLFGTIKAQSNADALNSVENTLFVNASPAPTVATYVTVRDGARLIFVTSLGNNVTLLVPAPLAALFMSDQQTVDPTAAAAIITAAIGVLTDDAGNAVTAYIGGFRVVSKLQPL